MHIKEELNGNSDRACFSGKDSKDVTSEMNLYLCQNQNQMSLDARNERVGDPNKWFKKISETVKDANGWVSFKGN